MAKIKGIKAKEILDSKRKPTVKVRLLTDEGKFLASLPSGVSKGKYEAKELNAKIAVKNVNRIIAPRLQDREASRQKEIDKILINLDGTKNKSRLGANAILGVSLAVCRAGARANKMPLWKWISKIANIKPRLPFPSLLQIEGGLHAKKGPDIQEFMTVFQNKSFKENFNQGLKIYNALREILLKKYDKTAIRLGLEGAFIPFIKKTEDVLGLIMVAAKKAGLHEKTKIILDIAATHDRLGLAKPIYYLGLAKQYPILGFEDPFPQDDWRNWQKLMLKTELSFMKAKGKKRIESSSPIKNSKIMIIGDDLTVTNPERIKEARKKKACNAVIIKPNQIGTVSEAIAAAKLAKSFGWKIMVSHRSGETMDDFIADLAVGIGADFIKAGAPSKPERMAKYNRLLEIEKELCQN